MKQEQGMTKQQWSRIKSDFDRIRIRDGSNLLGQPGSRSNLSGQTGSGSMNFLRPDPDPDTSVLRIFHIYYDDF